MKETDKERCDDTLITEKLKEEKMNDIGKTNVLNGSWR